MTPVSSHENFDYTAIVNKLATLKPKFVNISGGEPTLVPQLASVLERMKKSWNPRIYIVHNGTQPHKLLPLLQSIDRIVVSIDGPGEYNKRNRGIDGDAVLQKLGAIVPDARRNNVEVTLNCVVTRENVPVISELALKVREVSEHIILCFSPVMPPLGALSVLTDATIYNTFRDEYQRLRTNGFNVIQTFDNLLIHEDFSRIQCHNQFFGFRVTPEGRFLSCAMNMPTDIAGVAGGWRKLFRHDGPHKAVERLRKWYNNRVRQKIDFTCTTICYCEAWLDVLFLNKTNESIPVYCKGLAERMNENDFKELDMFVRQHINPKFDCNAFRLHLR